MLGKISRKKLREVKKELESFPTGIFGLRATHNVFMQQLPLFESGLRATNMDVYILKSLGTLIRNLAEILDDE